MKPEIIFQDKEFIVINKPAGLSVNRADTSRLEYTLQDWVEENFDIPKTSESDFAKRGGIVHRLDKETSGALVIALTEKSFISLQKQFKEKKVKKKYLALCHGKLIEEGEINVPIGRLPWNRMRFGVIPQGRESYTSFKTIGYFEFGEKKNREVLSLVEVFPKTGRTHQIRVHFQYAGHPLFADSLYAGRKNIQKDRKLLNRHFLHASYLSVEDPESGKAREFEVPLTNQLSSFLKTLHKVQK